MLATRRRFLMQAEKKPHFDLALAVLKSFLPKGVGRSIWKGLITADQSLGISFPFISNTEADSLQIATVAKCSPSGSTAVKDFKRLSFSGLRFYSEDQTWISKHKESHVP